jgi:enamine deaminase RidA (YjgF/YER057c/UK114 family)
VDSSELEQIDALIDAIDAALATHGLGLAEIVRTRILAMDRPARDRASQIRTRRLLEGPGVSSSSSYLEPRLFPNGDGVRFEGLALAGAGEGKVVEPYETGGPLCRYVATGDLVFNTGVTSTLPTFAEQLANLAPRIATTLAHASERLGRPVLPTTITAFVDRIQDPGTAESLADRLGMGGVPLVVQRCDGFTLPGKLIEVEVDAVAG